jgi:hypothetical protein
MKITRFIVMAAFLSLLVAGCYTVLQHPRTEMTAEDSFPRHCSECHGSADYYYWHYPYHYGWYWGYSNWRSYYYDPWWWDDYWYWRYDDEGEHVEKGQRHLWQPRTPPTTPGLAPGTSQDVKEKSKAPAQDTEQAEKKQDTKEKRRLWQPRKPPEKPKEKEADQPEQKKSDRPAERKQKEE